MTRLGGFSSGGAVVSADGDLLYKPSPWGVEYHQIGPDIHEALGAGAAGPGKSLVLLFEPFHQIFVESERQTKEYHEAAKTNSELHPIDPGKSIGVCLHMRRQLGELDETLSRADRFFPEIDPGAKFNAEKKIWSFSSGYKIKFGHCKDPDDWKQYYSQEYSFIIFDELTQFTDEQYDQITTRCRSSDPILRQMLKIRSMSNPVTIKKHGQSLAMRGNPNWVRDLFVAPAREGRKVLSRNVEIVDQATGKRRVEQYRRMYLPAMLTDNPDKDFVRDYQLKLASKPPHIRDALMYGDWFVRVGGFYENVWSPAIHKQNAFKIPSDWRWFRSMDWGFVKPGCIHWWALSDEDELVCVREYWFSQKLAEEVAQDVCDIETDMGLWDVKRGCSKISGPADTQLWEERGDQRTTKAEMFERAGVRWDKADKRSRQRNAELLYGRLKRRGGEQRDGTWAPQGITFFAATCPRITEHIQGVGASDRNPEEPEDTGDDHAHDSALYACAWATKPQYIDRPKLKEESEGEDEEDFEDETDNGMGYGDVA